jgi:hypothetical protein
MSPVLLTGASLEAETAKSKPKTKAAAGPAKIEALNPRGIPPPITLIPMAPRLDTLDGKTVYLISDGFPSADLFLGQVAIWFKKNMPGVTTVYRLKAGGYGDDDPKLRAEVKDKGNAVIMAIGH